MFMHLHQPRELIDVYVVSQEVHPYIEHPEEGVVPVIVSTAGYHNFSSLSLDGVSESTEGYAEGLIYFVAQESWAEYQRTINAPIESLLREENAMRAEFQSAFGAEMRQQFAAFEAELARMRVVEFEDAMARRAPIQADPLPESGGRFRGGRPF